MCKAVAQIRFQLPCVFLDKDLYTHLYTTDSWAARILESPFTPSINCTKFSPIVSSDIYVSLIWPNNEAQSVPSLMRSTLLSVNLHFVFGFEGCETTANSCRFSMVISSAWTCSCVILCVWHTWMQPHSMAITHTYLLCLIDSQIFLFVINWSYWLH